MARSCSEAQREASPLWERPPNGQREDIRPKHCDAGKEMACSYGILE